MTASGRKSVTHAATYLMAVATGGAAPLAALLFTAACGQTTYDSLVIDAPTLEIDGAYRSMEGPSHVQQFRVLETERPQLLWITGYSSEVVDEAGNPTNPEFLCHTNLSLVDARDHAARMHVRHVHSRRLFTTSQGMNEIRFPDGFGIPIWSDESLELTTQVLNQNDSPTKRVKGRVTITFARDASLRRPIRALYMTAANGLVLLDGHDGYYGIAESPTALHGMGSQPGENAGHTTRHDGHGRTFSGHWVVPPGEWTWTTLVTRWMNLRHDTKAHFIAVHVHPFAESVALNDLTTGRSVFESSIVNTPHRVGIETIETYADSVGVPLFRSHEYELVSRYRNPSGADVTAMAVMYLYVDDLEYHAAWRDRGETGS